MADYRAATRNAALRYGLDPDIFSRQIQQESGFNPHAVSQAGARGIAQIMPATARGWGVDPSDPIASLDAAAKNMARYVKQFGSYRNALVAYNAGPGRVGGALPAETQNYIKTILGGSNPAGLGTPKQTSSAVTAAATMPTPTTASALQMLTLPERKQPPVTGPALPAFAAKAMTFATQGAPQAERLTATSALKALDQLSAAQAPQAQAPAGSSAPASGGGVTPLGGSQNAGEGSFKISGPSPDRLKPNLVSFARKVADVLGEPLVGLDGSTHSKFTVNGNVSQHYTGNATDIFTINGKPAQGAALIRAGRAALIAAGMPRAKALKAPGGLYNVGSHQIIFGVNGQQYGGDHTDHLHISAR